MLRRVRCLGCKSTIITSFSIINVVILSFTLKLPLFSIYKLIEDHNDLFFWSWLGHQLQALAIKRMTKVQYPEST